MNDQPLMTLRVGTWNVQYARGVEKNAQRRAVLDARDADVWVLTETHDDLDLSATHTAVRTTPRYSGNPSAFWTTIWTRLPVIETLPTRDPNRTVCARLAHPSGTEVVVYGTVLPWHSDKGPDPDRPAKNWGEFMRVTPIQGAEWRKLRAAHPAALLLVAGDLNQSLGGPHYYGTLAARALLREQLAAANLECLTEHERFPLGDLVYSPIDHVCAAPPADRRLSSTVRGWPKLIDGVTLSDHSGVVGEITIVKSSAGVE